ncbi:MAG: ferritin-like domain-containing protein [Gemmatimonadales bacterium]|nr:ferritin-like domain-containing protein [Gemmatimonadales bacterium]
MRRRPRYSRNWNSARAGGESLEQLKELLAALRAAYLTYRTAHWQASGDAYYGDHLMLQRIYEESEKHIDQVGERVVGYYGASAVDLADQTERVADWSTRFARERDPVRASLVAAEEVRDLLTQTYDMLESQGQLTLGLDDLLMSISNDKDSHVYLLQQALSGRKASRAREANPRLAHWRLTR